jgi:hypothetical protein
MDAIVHAFSHTHAHAADRVSAVAGVTIWPVLDVAALIGGFELPLTGQKVAVPKRTDGNQENIEPKKPDLLALGRMYPACRAWRIWD